MSERWGGRGSSRSLSLSATSAACPPLLVRCPVRGEQEAAAQAPETPSARQGAKDDLRAGAGGKRREQRPTRTSPRVQTLGALRRARVLPFVPLLGCLERGAPVRSRRARLLRVKSERGCEREERALMRTRSGEDSPTPTAADADARSRPAALINPLTQQSIRFQNHPIASSLLLTSCCAARASARAEAAARCARTASPTTPAGKRTNGGGGIASAPLPPPPPINLAARRRALRL